MLKALKGCLRWLMSKLAKGDVSLNQLVLRELRQLRFEQREDVRLLAENQQVMFDAMERCCKEILAKLAQIESTLAPRLTSLIIQIEGGSMAASIEVGKTVNATVAGFDQNGQPFDLAGQAVAWTVDNSAVATAAPADGNPTVVTGVGAGTANLSVTVGGLTATDQVTVTAPAPVLTSLQIQFS